MRSRKMQIAKLSLLALMLLAALFFFGCKKKAEEGTQAQAGQIEQKTCPVMPNNPIDKNIYVEYQGKKVYFCCPECKPVFEKDPEKYLDKLPQFKDQMEEMKEQAGQTMDKASEEMEKAAEKLPEIE